MIMKTDDTRLNGHHLSELNGVEESGASVKGSSVDLGETFAEESGSLTEAGFSQYMPQGGSPERSIITGDSELFDDLKVRIIELIYNSAYEGEIKNQTAMNDYCADKSQAIVCKALNYALTKLDRRSEDFGCLTMTDGAVAIPGDRIDYLLELTTQRAIKLAQRATLRFSEERLVRETVKCMDEFRRERLCELPFSVKVDLVHYDGKFTEEAKARLLVSKVLEMIASAGGAVMEEDRLPMSREVFEKAQEVIAHSLYLGRFESPKADHKSIGDRSIYTITDIFLDILGDEGNQGALDFIDDHDPLDPAKAA